MATQVKRRGSRTCYVLKTMRHLSEQVDNLERIEQHSKEAYYGGQEIIKKLRDMSDYLETTHNKVLIADRVGTGLNIGSGTLLLGGLMVAPFSPQLSAQLIKGGKVAGIFGTTLSVGANVVDKFITDKSLASLKENIEQHYDSLVELSKCDSKYLKYASRFRSTLEQFSNLSNNQWFELRAILLKLVSRASDEDYQTIKKEINCIDDPVIKALLRKLSPSLDKKSLDALLNVCTEVILRLHLIKDAINAFVNYLDKPELARLAILYTTAPSGAGNDGGVLQHAFKGMALAMTNKDLTFTVANGLAIVASLVAEVDRMRKLWNETGETPTVQQLRKMANDLEKQLDSIRYQEH